MDVVTLALCRKLVSDAVTSIGDVFTLQGSVSSFDELPSDASMGDIYLVGPLSDGSYDEYYLTADGNWEMMGSTTSIAEGVLTEATLYAGEDGSGTIDNPAEDTILYQFLTLTEIYATETEIDELFEDDYVDNVATEEDIDALF